jgi:Carbohydrate binding domain
MRATRPSAIVSPESVATLLVGILAVVLMTTQVVASPTPTPTGSPSPGPATSGAAAPTLPALIRTSIATLLIVNERLAQRADELGQVIAADDPLAEDIAAILRGINTEITVGNEAANRLLTHRDTLALGQDLAAFYETVANRNAETLGTSIRNTAAYVDGARAVIELLGGLGPFNDRLRAALDGSDATPSVAPVSPSPSAPASPPPTAPPTIGPSPSPSGGSAGTGDTGLVVNGNFEDDLAGWRLLVTEPAIATATAAPGAGVGGSSAARIDTAAGSDARAGISFVKGGIALRQGASYTITLAVRAAATREIRVRVTGAGGLTYAARIFTVGTAWTVVEFDLDQLATDPAAELTLDLGRSDATVWFDDVTLRESPG